jgi:hypothetical protein
VKLLIEVVYAKLQNDKIQIKGVLVAHGRQISLMLSMSTVKYGGPYRTDDYNPKGIYNYNDENIPQKRVKSE